jgi:hypothetical protein
MIEDRIKKLLPIFFLPSDSSFSTRFLLDAVLDLPVGFSRTSTTVTLEFLKGHLCPLLICLHLLHV